MKNWLETGISESRFGGRNPRLTPAEVESVIFPITETEKPYSVTVSMHGTYELLKYEAERSGRITIHWNLKTDSPNLFWKQMGNFLQSVGYPMGNGSFKLAPWESKLSGNGYEIIFLKPYERNTGKITEAREASAKLQMELDVNPNIPRILTGINTHILPTTEPIPQHIKTESLKRFGVHMQSITQRG